MERSKKAGGGPVSLQVHVYTGGRFYFLCVCLFFLKRCVWGFLAALPTLAFVFLSGFTPFNAPAMLIASMCVSALCFLSCRLSWGPCAPPFLHSCSVCGWNVCRKPTGAGFAGPGLAASVDLHQRQVLCSAQWDCWPHGWEWPSVRGHSYLVSPKHTLNRDPPACKSQARQ